MKTPPFLLGAALLFWGWQTGFFAISAAMAVALESARWVKANWEFSDEDFSRIWTFCSVLFLGMVVYTLTASDVAGELSGLARNPYFLYQRNAGAASARAAATLVRWIPMVFFPFAAAQLFSSREEIPLTTMSLILRRRRQQDRKLGRPLPPVRSLNLSYPYFAACLSAASIHTGADIAFFGGLSVLMAWALWPQRSRRFGVFVWAGALLTAIALGYFSQRGVGQLQGYLDRLNPVWLLRFSRRGFDPMQNRTMLGQIGRVKLSGKIGIRLEPKAGSRAPMLLRENSYRFYGTQVSPVWYTGGSEEDFVPVQSETNETTWMLLPEKTNTATVNIACYLAGGRALLPLPTGSGRLDLNLPAFALQKNRTGAVFAQGLRFITFDAHYGPGASIDAAASTDR